VRRFWFWITLAVALGPVAFLLSFGVPLVVGNAIIMALLLSNHSLSPHTDVNDPLVKLTFGDRSTVLEWAFASD
jgi:hypothetical protein